LGRTFGYIIGAISTKVFITKFRYHTLMTYAVIGVSLSAIAFNFCSNIYLQTFWIGINTLIIAYYDVIGNTSLLIFNKDSDKQFWVQIAHSMFGVGNLTAPLIVYFS
jgi:fucose permease